VKLVLAYPKRLELNLYENHSPLEHQWGARSRDRFQRAADATREMETA